MFCTDFQDNSIYSYPVPVVITNFISADLNASELFSENLDQLVDVNRDFITYTIPFDGYGIFTDIKKVKQLVNYSE